MEETDGYREVRRDCVGSSLTQRDVPTAALFDVKNQVKLGEGKNIKQSLPSL